MKYSWYFFAGIWLFMIIFPKVIAYIVWGLFLFIWLNILFFKYSISKNKSSNKKDKDWVFFQIWDYKIYK